MIFSRKKSNRETELSPLCKAGSNDVNALFWIIIALKSDGREGLKALSSKSSSFPLLSYLS